MSSLSALRKNYLAAQDAVLNYLNEEFLPDLLKPSLIDSRWHYRQSPSKIGGPCATQGSYRLYFKFGDIYALQDMARIGDILNKHGIRFSIGGMRDGQNKKLILMVPQTDIRRMLIEQEGVRS
jgi:hypothetical protein